MVVQPPVPTPEPVQTNGANGEHPVTAPPTNGEAPLPVVAGFDTAIITHEPAPEPAEQNGGPEKNGGSETNGEHLLTPSRNNGEELQPIALAPERKITARKTNRPKRKKPALTRVASRARR